MKEHELDGNGYLTHMSDLKASYRETYRIVKDSMDRCNAESAAINNGIETEHKDTKIKKGIIEDLNLAINWLHTGKMPGSKRGIERRSAYQREKLMDPLRMQAFVNPTNSRSVSTLTSDQLQQIENALCKLTEKERECYSLAHGDCLSFSEIANKLGISKGGVQSHIQHARKKVSHYLKLSLFTH